MISVLLSVNVFSNKQTFVLQSQDKVALRNLSMVLRQLGSDGTERARFVQESVEKAKEALQLDVKDGTSWCE